MPVVLMRRAIWTPPTALPAPRFNLDLTNPAVASQLTCVRSTGGYHDDLDGVWTSFAINAPRITNRGLRAEPARTNSIRNNSMQGAVVGVIGSGGALPTNWQITSNFSTTLSVVGTGTENGVDYIDIRFQGTGSAAGLIWVSFESTTQIVAANGQTWVSSAFLKTVAGDVSRFDDFPLYFGWATNDASGNYLGDGGNGVSLPAAGPLTRYASIGTIVNASVARVQPFIYGQFAIGVPLDYTARIGWPQLELVNTAAEASIMTSPIRTTAVAVTRSADIVTVANFGSWYVSGPGTILIEGKSDAYTTVEIAAPVNITDITTNSIEFTYYSSAFIYDFLPGIEGVVDGPVGPSYKLGLAWATNDIQFYANGKAAEPRTGNGEPTYTTLYLGSSDLGYVGTDGPITRFAYWSARISNSFLQQLTTG